MCYDIEFPCHSNLVFPWQYLLELLFCWVLHSWLRQVDYNGHITIQLSNVTTRTITIPPKVVICELQPVTIQPKPFQENQPVETLFLDKVEINNSDLSGCLKVLSSNNSILCWTMLVCSTSVPLLEKISL
jgi:hypothetical protein